MSRFDQEVFQYKRMTTKDFLFLFVLYFIILNCNKVHTITPNDLHKTPPDDMCKWKSIVRNGKLRGGIGSGTFHRLGYTPSMETCIDLCCNMDVCGVAFRTKDDCFGIECNSDESCESIPADSKDVKVEIAHVRAGHKSVNLTDITMAGQCHPSRIYKEVTLKGGINAGTYKDVGGVNTMEECTTKCCEFPACDLAFMLAGSCYLVGCTDQKQCAMQPAKESKFHPMISYVTRWNNEGVKHTVLLQEKDIQHTCNKIVPLTKVTLKGGLQAGEFTDVGKVPNLAQCYDVCCQQEKCDLAFMLGQNCFSVQCKDKRLCGTIPAQPSIFNPQIAYVTKRERNGVAKSEIPKGYAGECPNTKVFDKMTLKGGVDAGAYKDHGKVKEMDVCRRICCEITECHLAFMLGSNCFSVKCSSIDSCRAQKAKPSAYYPKISYVRKIGTNELLPNMVNTTPNMMNHTNTILAPTKSDIVKQLPSSKLTSTTTQSTKNNLQEALKIQNTKDFAISSSGLSPIGKSQVKKLGMSNTSSTAQQISTNKTSIKIGKDSLVTSLNTNKTNITKEETLSNNNNKTNNHITNKINLKENDNKDDKNKTGESGLPFTDEQTLMKALEAADSTNSSLALPISVKMPINTDKCAPGRLKKNVTLKGGRKSGEFIEIKGLKDMKDCVKRCCEDRDKKCNLAFMLGNTCYSVACKNEDLCRTIPAPPTKFNPLVQYVRGLKEEPIPSTTEAPATTAPESVTLSDETTSVPKPTEKEVKEVEKKKSEQKTKHEVKKNKLKSCVSQPIVKDKSLSGGKKAGKFRLFKDIKDMDSCMGKCCSLKKQCDIAYMEDSKCYSIQCTKKSTCTAVALKESDVNPQFAYTDHFLEKVDEEDAVEKESTTELDVAEESSCTNVEVISNKTLKGGTKAGKFRAMGKSKSMKSCINNCCDRPDCDIAYLLNDHCYAVECTDGSLCQSTSEPSKAGDSVQLAYMNKGGIGEKRGDFMVVYIIVGSLAFAATIGGVIWAVFAFSRKQKIKNSHKRLLDDEEEEPMDDVVHKRTSHTSRYRQPRY